MATIPEIMRRRVAEEQQKQMDIRNTDNTLSSGSILTGPGDGRLDVYGTQETRAGALEGLQLGQMLYGQGMADVGKEAAEYSSMVKSRLGKDYAGADVQRQLSNQALAKNQAKLGLGGTNAFGAQEQLRRQGSMQAAQMNQDYQDKAMALYGKNISAKQQGMTSQYFSGKGTGQANTPTPVQVQGGGLSIICTELHNQGKLTKNEYLRASAFGYTISPYTYFGYLTIAKPIVKLMKKSDKFSNLFIGWAKSIAKQRPNLLTKALMPLCWVIGYVGTIKKEKSIRGFAKEYRGIGA